MVQSPSIKRPVEVIVKTRGPDGGINGESGGWQDNYNLRCDQVKVGHSVRFGFAKFVYIPATDQDPSFETILADTSVDDQVRVEVVPSARNDSRVLFEGVLVRHIIDVQADQRSSRERVKFVAMPFPWLDNRLFDHLVKGRWVADPDEEGQAEVWVVESPFVPPVFNFRDRPNCHGTATITSGGITAPVFTHDDDPNGRYWTVGQALASLLCDRLYGSTGGLSRTVGVEQETVAAFNQADAGGDLPPNFVGLELRLAETNVYGKGVFDAFAIICARGGFDFAVETGGESDRPYTLRLWRRNTGKVTYLDMDKRGSSYPSAQLALAKNNVSKLVAMRDGAEIVNSVLAVGRTYFEASFTLKPLWFEDEVDTEQVSAEMQSATEDQLEGSGYHAKHVNNGAMFWQFGHVGRLWGLDCVGGFINGYPAAPYVHDQGGFDFVKFLITDRPNEEFTNYRDAHMTSSPVRWTRRLRFALPMRNTQAVLQGVKYVLEVSEDAGASWSYCHHRFETLTDYFGIYIPIRNLAAINNASIGQEQIPQDVETSWWKLMLDKKLLFRLTCAVEADNALHSYAAPLSTSGSRYPRGQLIVTQAQGVWHAGPTPFTNLNGIEDGGIDIETVRDGAKLRRDSAQDARLAVSALTWVMDFDRYRLGDLVASVRGRDYSLRVNSGSPESYPNIVGLDYRLGAQDQSIRLSLDDDRLIGGAS